MKNHFLDFKKLFKKTQDNFFKMPWFFGKHAFLIILFFILIAMALGGLLYYNYVIVEKEVTIKNGQGVIRFRRDVYIKILEKWEDKKQEVIQPGQTEGENSENIENIEKNYKNPFVKSEQIKEN
jgi:hypothetical protein